MTVFEEKASAKLLAACQAIGKANLAHNGGTLTCTGEGNTVGSLWNL